MGGSKPILHEGRFILFPIIFDSVHVLREFASPCTSSYPAVDSSDEVMFQYMYMYCIGNHGAVIHLLPCLEDFVALIVCAICVRVHQHLFRYHMIVGFVSFGKLQLL